MPFPGTGIPLPQWDPATVENFKIYLRAMYRTNEWYNPSIGATTPYRFSNARGASHWSFGQAQWDLAKGSDGATFLGRLGFNSAEIDYLTAQPPVGVHTPPDPHLNAVLVAHAAEIDQFFETKLNADLAMLRNRLSLMPQSVRQYMLDHPTTLVMLVDYNNQLGLDPNDANGLMSFLQGNRVTLRAPDGTHPVEIGLADLHPGMAVPQFDAGDYAWYYMNTWEARQSQNTVRQANRFLADLDEFQGANWPNLTGQPRRDLEAALDNLQNVSVDDRAGRLLSFQQRILPALLGRRSDLIPSDVIQAALGQVQAGQRGAVH